MALLYVIKMPLGMEVFFRHAEVMVFKWSPISYKLKDAYRLTVQEKGCADNINVRVLKST